MLTNKTKIDLNTWKRKDHFNLFSKYDNPQFSVVANIDCTELFNLAKKMNLSFFLVYLYVSNKITNEIDEFKLRIEKDSIFRYDIIHPSSTIGRKDETFGFGYFITTDNFKEFYEASSVIINKVKNSSGLNLNDRLNTVYYSVLPWVSFTSIQNPDIHSADNCIPRIVFGKIKNENGKIFLPTSVTANHSLIDGYHISKYFHLFELYNKKAREVIQL